MAVIAIMSSIFATYLHFRVPQEKNELSGALAEQRIQYEREATALRFKDVQDSFQALLLQSNNHIHTIQEHVEVLSKNVNEMNVSIAKLGTILEERLPRKML